MHAQTKWNTESLTLKRRAFCGSIRANRNARTRKRPLKRRTKPNPASAPTGQQRQAAGIRVEITEPHYVMIREEKRRRSPAPARMYTVRRAKATKPSRAAFGKQRPASETTQTAVRRHEQWWQQCVNMAGGAANQKAGNARRSSGRRQQR